MIGLRSRSAAALQRAAVPLAAYYAVTLVLPLANGAASAGAPFAMHAVMVLAVPPAAVMLVGAVVAVARAVFHSRDKTDATADTRAVTI